MMDRPNDSGRFVETVGILEPAGLAPVSLG
jgi:hypothetical protein